VAGHGGGLAVVRVDQADHVSRQRVDTVVAHCGRFLGEVVATLVGDDDAVARVGK